MCCKLLWINQNWKLKLTRISFDISTPNIECRQEVHFLNKDFQHFWFQNVMQNALKSVSRLSTGSLVLKIYQRILKIYCSTQTSFTKLSYWNCSWLSLFPNSISLILIMITEQEAIPQISLFLIVRITQILEHFMLEQLIFGIIQLIVKHALTLIDVFWSI